MEFFSRLLLLINFSIIIVKAADINSIQRDLAEFNITCRNDNCKSDKTGKLEYRSCQCGIQCVQWGTCCIDSDYANIPEPELKPACRSLYNNPSTYFIVDQCSDSSVWSNLCNNEWNEEDDVLKLVPVTSLSTSITYKNYYCLRCHETTDEFIYWEVTMESNNDQPNVSFAYDRDMESWTAIYDETIGYFPVRLTVRIHPEISKLVDYCERDVISNCPNEWYDDEVRNKCQSYMSLKKVKETNGPVKLYKNIHCVLCNFESLDNMSCAEVWPYHIKRGVSLFSFVHLLDVNPSGGELVGKIKKCPDDHVWDPFTSKCRELTCALPGYKLENEKCVQK